MPRGAPHLLLIGVWRRASAHLPGRQTEAPSLIPGNQVWRFGLGLHLVPVRDAISSPGVFHHDRFVLPSLHWRRGWDFGWGCCILHLGCFEAGEVRGRNILCFECQPLRCQDLCMQCESTLGHSHCEHQDFTPAPAAKPAGTPFCSPWLRSRAAARTKAPLSPPGLSPAMCIPRHRQAAGREALHSYQGIQSPGFTRVFMRELHSSCPDLLDGARKGKVTPATPPLAS